MIVIFKDKALCDSLLQEVTVTESGVWTYQGPRFDGNLYTPAQSADGRCAMCHNFSEEDEAFLRTYCGGLDVQFLEGDALPEDWQYSASEDVAYLLARGGEIVDRLPEVEGGESE